MYRKKLMRACLTGLMVVTVATANVAPVFAAEAPAGTETTTSKASVVKAQFVDAAGTVVAGGDYFVDADGDGVFNVSELPVPEGYKAETGGDFFTKDYADTALQVTVDKIAKASVVKAQFVDAAGTVVAGGDYFVDADGDGIFNVSELPVPEGYKAETVGDFFTKDYADTALQVTVDKIAKASIINVQFMDGNKVVAGGDYFVDADGDGIFNLSELPVPEGYELSLAGDQFVKDYVGKTTQLKVKVVKAATMKVVYKDQTTQEVVGEETLTGSRQDADGNYVFDAAVDFNIPFGYQLAVDYPVETLKAGETKTTECLVTARETVLHITFETQDGEVVGTKTVSTTSQGADGECWTFMLGTDFDLPEGVDQITNIQIPFGSTGGHTMVVEKGDLSSIVKIQFVDAENNDEVVAGGDYFVDGDGDGIFHTREITEWVPEGYELQEVGDFQVELYKETPLQLSVTKIKEDKPETPDPEEPNKPEKPEAPDQEKPEKPEKPNKEDDKKEDKKDEKKNSPKTGDETNAAAVALPAGVSLAAILAVLVKKFK